LPPLARPAVWETVLTTLFQDSSLDRLIQTHFSQGFARHSNVCWKRDYVYQACLETLEEVRWQGPSGSDMTAKGHRSQVVSHGSSHARMCDKPKRRTMSWLAASPPSLGLFI